MAYVRPIQHGRRKTNYNNTTMRKVWVNASPSLPPCVSNAPFPNQPSPHHSPTERGQPKTGGFRVTRDPTPEACLKPPGREGCCVCVLHEPATCGSTQPHLFDSLLLLLAPSAVLPGRPFFVGSCSCPRPFLPFTALPSSFFTLRFLISRLGPT